MTDSLRRRRRVFAALAVGAAGALLAAGCQRPGPRPPTPTDPAPATTASPTGPTGPTGPTVPVDPTGPSTTVPPSSPGRPVYDCKNGPQGPTTTMPGDTGHGDHGHGGAAGPIDTGGAHNIPPRLNHPPTAEQRAAAEDLIARTKAAAPRFADYKVAESLGYKSIGDNRTGVAHYVNREKRQDGRILDPENVEALVYTTNPSTGAILRLQTFMYILEEECTMDNIPDIAGNLTVWHAHDNLCYKKSDPGVLSGVLVDGKCFPASSDSVFVPSKPMLHVWIIDNPCGPFAGTDRGNRTGSCDSGH